jgi:hypothetical protein
MNMHVKTTIILFITLTIGFALGALTMSSLRRSAIHRFADIREPRGLIDFYSKEFDLTEAQRDSIGKIFKSYHPRMMQLATKHRAMLKQLQDSLHAELAPFLTKEQLKRLNESGAFGRGKPPIMRNPDFRFRGEPRGRKAPDFETQPPPGGAEGPETFEPPPPPPRTKGTQDAVETRPPPE